MFDFLKKTESKKEVAVMAQPEGIARQGGRRLKGVVVSDKMQKTVVVAVERLKMNHKYRKQFKATTKLKAHDEQGQYHTGDHVVIEETRPLSKEKRWKVISKA